MSALSPPLDGGCGCGAVRYRISAKPLTLYACHCTSCQAQSTTAFYLSLWAPAEAFALTQGRLSEVEIPTESGRPKVGRFCPACGVRIVHVADGAPVVSVRAGTLDQRERLDPVGHIFTRSAQRWIIFPKDALLYAAAPDDGFQALIEAWRARDCGGAG